MAPSPECLSELTGRGARVFLLRVKPTDVDRLELSGALTPGGRVSWRSETASAWAGITESSGVSLLRDKGAGGLSESVSARRGLGRTFGRRRPARVGIRVTGEVGREAAWVGRSRMTRKAQESESRPGAAGLAVSQARVRLGRRSGPAGGPAPEAQSRDGVLAPCYSLSESCGSCRETGSRAEA